MDYAAAFLAAIQEAPDDDAPRLIYADWLDEQGDADRAEFVRAQCALARLDDDDDRGPALEARERALWKKHGKTWRQPLTPFSRKFAFARGFPEEVLVPARTFVDRAADAFAAARLFAVRLRNAKTCIDEVAACPYLERLTSFSLYWNNLGLGRTQVFCRSPHLTRLTSLSLRTNAIRPGGVRALLGARLNRLRSLDLEDNEIGDAGVEELVGSELLGRLTALNLARNELTPAGVRALVGSPSAARLAELNLTGNDAMGDDVARALAASPHLGALRRLTMSSRPTPGVRQRVGLRPDGAAALAASPLFGRLAALRFWGNESLGDEGLAALAAGAAGVTELTLDHCDVGNEGLAALASSPLLAGLRTLSLAGGRYTAAGLTALVGSPHVRGLRVLRLRRARLGRAGGEALAAPPHLEGLRQLDLRSCDLTSAGIAALAASPHLAGLHRLNLLKCRLQPEALRALARSPHLTRLRALVVLETADQRKRFADKPGWKELFDRFGDAVTVTPPESDPIVTGRCPRDNKK